MMQASHTMQDGATHRPWRKFARLLAVIGVSTTFSFSAFAASSFSQELLSPLDTQSDAGQQEAVRFDEKPVSAMPLENEFMWMTSVEKACALDPAEQVAQRLTVNETLRDALATQIRKIYRIDEKDARIIVDTAVKVSDAHDVDPFIVLSIASVESSMNPKAQSSYGAAGLMQVYAPSHRQMLEGLGVDTTDQRVAVETLMHDLETNLVAGTRIYRQYLKQYKTVPMALQAYNGAKNDATKKYARKVLKRYDQYQQVVSAHAHIAQAHAAIADGDIGTRLVAGAMRGFPDYSAIAALSDIADQAPRRFRSL